MLTFHGECFLRWKSFHCPVVALVHVTVCVHQWVTGCYSFDILILRISPANTGESYGGKRWELHVCKDALGGL